MALSNRARDALLGRSKGFMGWAGVRAGVGLMGLFLDSFFSRPGSFFGFPGGFVGSFSLC